MRLDFDHDGSVSIDDLKSSMTGLYDFLRNFDAIESKTLISVVDSLMILFLSARLKKNI